ncbi:MAG: hypothetical protein KF861_21955, partial [Planctomycetaceae bacterium]|nr:hypothetical protein [Planctomycetaceae bacterium]
DSYYVGWPELVRMTDANGEVQVRVETPDQWRPFWDRALTNRAVVDLARTPAEWMRPTALLPAQVAPEDWHMVLEQPVAENVGCRPGELSGFPLDMIAHVTVASRAPDIPEGIGPHMTVDETPMTFDLTRRSSLGNFLENDACRDGSHVIASGSGLHKLSPFEIIDKSIRLEFRQIGTSPLIIQLVSEREARPAGITVRNGALDIMGGRFKIPATSSPTQTPWLIRLEDASLSLRECTLEGPSTLTAGHAGLIEIADASQSPAPTSRSILILDSYLISPGPLLSGPIRWDSLILRNCVLATQHEAIRLRLDDGVIPHAPMAWIDDCTVAAGGAVIQFSGEPPASEDREPLNLIVSECVFAGPVGTGSDAAVVVSRESARQTDANVRWWGNANGFAPTLRQFVMTNGVSTGNGFESEWTSTWGAGHEVHPLFGPADVMFAKPLPGWSELTPSSFLINPASPAATWAADRTPIGADVDQVGSPGSRSASSNENSPRGNATRRSPAAAPNRSQSRNPF